MEFKTIRFMYAAGDVFTCLDKDAFETNTDLLWVDPNTLHIWCLDTEFNPIGMLCRSLNRTSFQYAEKLCRIQDPKHILEITRNTFPEGTIVKDPLTGKQHKIEGGFIYREGVVECHTTAKNSPNFRVLVKYQCGKVEIATKISVPVKDKKPRTPDLTLDSALYNEKTVKPRVYEQSEEQFNGGFNIMKEACEKNTTTCSIPDLRPTWWEYLENKTATHRSASSILKEADKIVNGDRNEQYGDPTQAFQEYSDILKASFGIVLSPVEICKVQMAIKLGCMKHKHKRDSIVDLCGYAEILNRLEDAKL